MSNRIDGNFQPQLFQTGGSSEAAEAAQGNFNGRQVSVQPNAMSLLADAAEELTFSAQETQEKKISERKLLEEGGSAERYEKIEKLLERLGDLEKSDLERFLDAMKKEATLRNLDRLLGEVKDPTHRHAMLSYAKEMLGESTEARALVEKALTKLMEQEGPAVRAGYNIAGIKGEAFLGDQAALRNLYRGTVLDYQSFTQAFDQLADKYGAKEFPKALEFLIRALSADMAATTPSTTMSQMKNIMDDLYMLEVLKNFYADSEKLLERLVEFCGRNVDKAKPQDIMSPLLRLKDENFVQSSQLTAVMPFLISEHPPCDVQFIQGLKDNVRKLPHKIFSDTDKRYNLLDAIQDLLDDAIDREEEMEF